MGLGRSEFLLGLLGQFPQVPEDKEKPKRLPDGTLQSEAILKDEQKKLLEDAARLIQLSQDVEAELKKNTHNVLSVGLLKKLDEVEKLARRMRGRHNR